MRGREGGREGGRGEGEWKKFPLPLTLRNRASGMHIKTDYRVELLREREREGETA